MKATKLNFPVKYFFFGALAAILMFSFTSCTKKISFLSSSVVPAAQGTVKVKTDSNKNYAIQIDIANLAEPGRLQPPRQMYIVWVVTDQDMTKNIGQIRTSSGRFSKGLKASFETVTSFKPTKIFITAENDSNIQDPNWEIVLATDQFQN
jgi:hypothetical protein